MRNQHNTHIDSAHANADSELVVHDYLDLYSSARKKDKGWILDEIMIVTGWSRDHTRRRLT